MAWHDRCAMNRPGDAYSVLQVDPYAEPEVIQAAYHALAKKYHPDLVHGSEERMSAINVAWAILGHPERRTQYDHERGLHSAPAAREMPASQPRPTVQRARPAADRGTILDYGRYAGWSLREIARSDPDFLEWLIRTPAGRRYQHEIETIFAERQAPGATHPGSAAALTH